MTPRNAAAVAASALAAAGVAVGVWAATGQVPDAPGQGECSVSWAMGSCEAARALSAGDVECEDGTLVTLPVEIVADPDADGGTGLPPGFDPVPGSSVAVDCAGHGRKGKSLTVVPMSKHGKPVRDGGPPCPPTVIDGHTPEGCL